jgi:putative FmdB family regulatory protein
MNMPIYEFYCGDCHTIFNFFSKTVNVKKKPKCPKCKIKNLTRQMSVFAFTGTAAQNEDMDDLPVDEAKMEKAMQALAKDADHINEDDPRQAADLMRKLTAITGLELGPGMNEALSRMERGDDPDTIEAEMGNIIENEDPFLLPGKKVRQMIRKRLEPERDETLYDL